MTVVAARTRTYNKAVKCAYLFLYDAFFTQYRFVSIVLIDSEREKHEILYDDASIGMVNEIC